MAQWFWEIELYMEKYTLGEILSSGGATLYKNPYDQSVAMVISRWDDTIQRSSKCSCQKGTNPFVSDLLVS